MPKKPTSLTLVKDRFLTNKFFNVNQHELAFWLNETMPEINWEYGEFGVCGYDNYKKKKCFFCFGIYINSNHSTITIAELKSREIKSQKQIVESAFRGKPIHKVLKVKNVFDEIWETPQSFQKHLHLCLTKYLNKSIQDTEQKS
ncbi:hypothetical protein EB118_16205 [bacterium]|nr:hypothetical protein [bacterium]NDG31596.1 hypothetical protein [bacterium]